MSYIIINQNTYPNAQIARTNYQLAGQHRICVSRSPIIYKNMKIQESKATINPVYRNISPKIINQSFVNNVYTYHSAIQSPCTIKTCIPSYTPSPSSQFVPQQSLTDRNKQVKSQSVHSPDNNTYYRNKAESEIKNKTNDGQKMSYLSSPNQTFVNQNASSNQSTPLTVNSFKQSGNTFQGEQSLLQSQQDYLDYHKIDQQTNTMRQNEQSSLRSTLTFRNTTHSESDQDLLDIVSKYIGKSSTSSSSSSQKLVYKTQSPKKQVNYHSEENNDSDKYQTQYSPYEQINKQQQQTLSQNNDSKIRVYNSIESSQCQQTAYTQADINANQNYQQFNISNSEYQKQSFPFQLGSQQIQSNCKQPQNQYQYNESYEKQQQNANYEQQIQRVDNSQVKDNSSSLNQTVDNSSSKENTYSIQQKYYDQNLEIYQNAEKVKQQIQQIQQQMHIIKNEIFPEQHQPNQKQCVSPMTVDPKDSKEIIEIKVIKKDYHLEIEKNSNGVQFLECSQNQDQKMNSSDDKLNLAVYEDDNQDLDFNSSESIMKEERNIINSNLEDQDDEDVQQQLELLNELNSLQQQQQQQQQNQKMNAPKALDPIQEEDIQSRSSIDFANRKQDLYNNSFSQIPSITVISPNNITNSNTNIHSVFSDVRISSKPNVPFTFEIDIANNYNQIQQQKYIDSTNANRFEDGFEIFNSELEDIVQNGEKGSQNNLFSLESCENILDLYNSVQPLQQKEFNSQSYNDKNHHRISSDVINNSQNFQTVSSIENTESFRRSLINQGSFSHSPQLSFGGQVNYQMENQMNSATFTQETLMSEQSPLQESTNQLIQAKITQLSKEDKLLLQEQQGDVVLKDQENATRKNLKNNTFGDIIVMIAFIAIVMLIGWFFIYFIQQNSLIGYLQQRGEDNAQKQEQIPILTFQNDTIIQYSILQDNSQFSGLIEDEYIDYKNYRNNLICYAICQLNETIFEIKQCLQNTY